MSRIQLLTIASALPAIALGERVAVDASLGWRFRLGRFDSTCNAASFPISLDGQQVNGLSHATEATDAATCLQAACANGADLWQWCVGGGAACGSPSCWIGSWPGSSNTQAGWQSGRSNSSGPIQNPPEAQLAYDDSKWLITDLPHDYEITGTYTSGANGGEGFLPYNVSFYRKHAVLPASWRGSRVEVYVEGALSASQWWLNGQPLASGTMFMSGYTSLILRIDDSPAVVWGGLNVLVAYVDGTKKTGWWYEGAGLYRRVSITSTPLSASIATHGVYAPANVTGAVTPHNPSTPAAGLIAPAVVHPKTLCRNDGATPSTLTVSWSLLDASGAVAASSTAPPLTVPAGSNATAVGPDMVLASAELWSVPRPYLYTLVTSVSLGGSVVDSVSASIGIRAATWDANTGFYLNGQHVKMRGYCDHENFGSIGAAMPARVDLLRMQQLRGTGGNALRTSHNAPEPALLHIADRLGIVVMDENRVFATVVSCPGCPSVPEYAGDPVQDMADLVSRDKLHPSVIWWSFCNEAGCGDGRAHPAIELRAASYAADGSRPVGANMGWLSPMTVTPMSDQLDVMGFSHADAATVANFHKNDPTKPLVMSECCSCETQRGEDSDQPHDSSVYFSNEASSCLSGETQRSNAVEFNAGTFIWTLHDYVGEPGNWPHVSSSFGSFDVGGIPKAASFWLRSWWLSNVSTSDAGRPPLDPATTTTTVRLVESWAPAGGGGNTRKLNAYSNAPFVQLYVNGAAQGGRVAMGPFSHVTWNAINYAPGNVTVAALSASGAVLATHTRKSWGAAVALRLSCDAPSDSTGTGSAVYLDGTDVALLRATVVDAAGNTVADSSANITFTVTAPGLVLGSVNGDPANHDPNQAPWKPAYHGVVRGIVRANVVAAPPDATRALLASVNPDAGGSPYSATILPAGSTPPTSMTVTVTSPGLTTATYVVALSVAPADEVFAVAAANVGRAAIGE